MDLARDFFERLNRAVENGEEGYSSRYFDLPFPLVGDAGTEIAYDRDDLQALHGMKLSQAIASGELIYDWRIVGQRACGATLTLVRTEVTLTPRGGAPSDPFYICRVARDRGDGPRLVAMINPLAFTRTARGLPAREGGGETALAGDAAAEIIHTAADAFAAGDVEAVHALCASPAVWIADAGTLVTDDTNFEESFVALKTAREARSSGTSFRVTVEEETSYGEALSLVRCRIDVAQPDGRPLDSYHAEFLLRQEDGRWLLAGKINAFGGRYWPTA